MTVFRDTVIKIKNILFCEIHKAIWQFRMVESGSYSLMGPVIKSKKAHDGLQDQKFSPTKLVAKMWSVCSRTGRQFLKFSEASI